MLTRIVVGALCAAVGIGLLTTFNSRALGLGVALGAYGLIEWLGWLPSPFEPRMSDLLRDDDKPSK